MERTITRQVSTDRGARLSTATVVLLRHAVACDRERNWMMARICWSKFAQAHAALAQHNAMRGLRKNTSERYS